MVEAPRSQPRIRTASTPCAAGERSASPVFELGLCGHATYPPGATSGPRTLRDFELIWILQGQVTWEVAGEAVAAGPGSVLLAQPGMRDRIEWDRARATRHGFAHFTLAPGGLEALGEPTSWPRIRRSGDVDALMPVLEQLIAVVQTDVPARDLLVHSSLSHALLTFVTGVTGAQPAPLDGLPEAVERALRVARERWTREGLRGPSLPELARAAGVSEGHLARLFRDAFGCGPAEVLRVTRLERAAQMLARTDMSVAEIATASGFVDPFHFSRAFKQAYGLSPRALRTGVRAGRTMPVTKLVHVRYVSRWLLDVGS